MTETIVMILVSLILAILLGNGSVVLFNRIKPEWFEDYDFSQSNSDITIKKNKNVIPRKVLPEKLIEADRSGRQRIPSTPWKYAFTGYFGIIGIALSIKGMGMTYMIAVMFLLFVVLEMAISDYLYKVVPDQLQLILCMMSVGFWLYHEKYWEPLAGCLVGILISISVLGLGMLIYKKGSIGGADIKYFAAIGMSAGREGIIIIFVLTTFFFAIEAFARIAFKRGSLKDSNAMLPAACVATSIYFVFLFNIDGFITL